MCSAVSAALAVASSAQRAMHYASSRRRSRAAVLVQFSRAPQQCHFASGPLWLKMQPSPARGSARRRRREESSAGARRRRRALFSASADGPRNPADSQLGSGSAPSAKQTGTPPCLRRREESQTHRRRRGERARASDPQHRTTTAPTTSDSGTATSSCACPVNTAGRKTGSASSKKMTA